MEFTEKQVKALARRMTGFSGGYMQALDAIAEIKGLGNNAGLAAVFKKDAGAPVSRVVSDLPEEDTVHIGTISDWREDDAVSPGDHPILPEIGVVLRKHATGVEIYLGGAEKDRYAHGAAVIWVEREGDISRVHISDCLSESGYVVEIKDGRSLATPDSDWKEFTEDDADFAERVPENIWDKLAGRPMPAGPTVRDLVLAGMTSEYVRKSGYYPYVQSGKIEAYQRAVDRLWTKGVVERAKDLPNDDPRYRDSKNCWFLKPEFEQEAQAAAKRVAEITEARAQWSRDLRSVASKV